MAGQQSSMTAYTVENIIKDVRVALDNNQNVNESLLNDIDTLSLNEIIESKIVEGVKQVHSIAPLHLLDYGYNVNGEFKENNIANSIHFQTKNNGSYTWQLGWVELPEDFMRLVVFEMSDWEKAVFELKSTDDAEYKKQQSQFKGIRATKRNPLCFLSIRPYGRILEFYPFNYTNDENCPTITRGVYIPYPEIIEEKIEDKIVNRYVYICSRCYNAIVYTIASLVLSAIGEVDKSSVFVELAKSTLL